MSAAAAPLPTPELPPLRDIIRRHGLDARRSLGQHFLLDGNLTDRIARVPGDLTETNVVEVGPGPGGLTRSLLAAGAARIVAVEKDPHCVAALAELAEAYPQRLQVIEADALSIDCRALVPEPRAIVANLPYNVGTPLLLGWLRQASAYRRLVLMFQKEVAHRLCARPGDSDYGRLAVITRWVAEAAVEFTIDPRAFTPPPRVTSAVVSLVPRPVPLAAADWDALERVTAAAFGQRRKMLRRSLAALGLEPAAVGIDPTRRAEDLSAEEFCALARQLAVSGDHPGAPSRRRRS
jgi:16S rRNA (adenine1518-N6/adenine1519-N6)-dimethyltransferase